MLRAAVRVSVSDLPVGCGHSCFALDRVMSKIGLASTTMVGRSIQVTTTAILSSPTAPIDDVPDTFVSSRLAKLSMESVVPCLPTVT